MALAQLNGVDVLEAQICMPSTGAWHADVVVDAPSTAGLAGQVQLIIGGVLSLAGTAQRFGAWAGTSLVRMIGGGGGLGLIQTPKAYQLCTAQLPLVDTLTAAGETLDPSTDAALLATPLTNFMRGTEPTSAVLDAICDLVPGSTWRVLPGGTIWLGTDTWPPTNLPFQILDYEPQSTRIRLGVDVPELVPGVSILGRKVVYLVHELKAASVVTVANLD